MYSLFIIFKIETFHTREFIGYSDSEPDKPVALEPVKETMSHQQMKLF